MRKWPSTFGVPSAQVLLALPVVQRSEREEALVRKGTEMRTFRVFVLGVLVASGLAMLAPGASASVPALSKTCKSLKSLDKVLNKVVTSSNYDSGTINNLSKSFRKAAKTAPQSLRSAMNAIAAVASDAAGAGSPTAAAAALKKDGQKLSAAAVTWGTYLSTNCAGSSSSTS